MIELDTPVLLVDEKKLDENIYEMACFAKKQGVCLRPHIKAHKSPWIAKKQLSAGSCGITVAKLGEAEIMAQQGIYDIFIAYQIVGEEKFRRLAMLSEKARLCVGIDSIQGGEYLNNYLKARGITLDYMLEINSGLNRCGVTPDGALNFYRVAEKWTNLQFRGIFTHAGHVYGVSNPGEVERIGNEEGKIMIEVARSLQEAGYEVPVISVGSTPTVKYSAKVRGVTEIRPGNYVFYDAIQVGLGVVPPERCALSVLARVISRPEKGRAIIDAGSKVFGLDKGAHGNHLVSGFGLVKDRDEIKIERLSEEHGILSVPPSCDLKVGDFLEIIPNHACTVVNMFDEFYIKTVEGKLLKKPVSARGKVV